MEAATESTTLLALVAGVVLAVWVCFTPSHRGPLPPGPRPLPILGNMLQMPKKWPWYQFTEWSKQYGPIYSLALPGAHVVVLNTHELISEHLGKPQLSDRPQLTVVGELMGFNQSMLLLSEGPELRLHKKLALMALNTTAVRRFAEVQREAVHRCVVRLLDTQDYEKELRVAIVRSIVRMTYGFTVDSLEDPFVMATENSSVAVGEALVPGRFLADTIPILKHVPLWFPGAGFKRYALRVKEIFHGICRESVKLVNRDLASGTAKPSFMSHLLADRESGSVECDDVVVGSIGGTLYGGGVDTTNSTLLTLVLLLCRNSHVQDAVYEEIKRVVGRDRLPVIDDRENMPYLVAVIQEVLRYHPVSPLGIPRRAAQDCFISGYFIPKNSTVIPNAWAVTREDDNSGFPADEFHPERFLSPSPPHAPSSYVFGVGRRACMGQDVAQNFLFLAAGSLLAAFTIRPPLDSEDREVLPDPAWRNTLVTRPESFDCRFVPRNEALLRSLAVQIEEDGAHRNTLL